MERPTGVDVLADHGLAENEARSEVLLLCMAWRGDL